MLKPVLFNTEMVKAILEGRKTSTRRIIKPQPKQPVPLGFISDSTDGKRIGYYGWGQDKYGGIIDIAKPPYRAGDILYVRETWRKKTIDKAGHIEIQYKADFNEEELACYGKRGGYAPCKWKPSIHMPKVAARIFLKVTDIKVQRLQDITEREVLKEGIKRYHFNMNMPDAYGDTLYTDHKLAFKTLWNSTVNKKDIDVYGWDADPYVWIIEFQRIEKEK